MGDIFPEQNLDDNIAEQQQVSYQAIDIDFGLCYVVNE